MDNNISDLVNRDFTSDNKQDARVKDIDSGLSDVGTVTPPSGGTGSGKEPPVEPKVYTASDGTTFTDPQAFATYASGLLAAKTASDTAASNKALQEGINATNAANQKIQNQNALQLLTSTLSGYGLDTDGSIANAILTMQQRNYDAPTIQALIQDPASAKSADPAVAALATAWNNRFPGNVTRIASGQNPLSPAEYIATENSYRNIIKSSGLTPGFYNSKEEMGKLIGNDIAPTELQDRVNVAAKSIANQDPFYTNTLQNYYGLSAGDMVAHALDPQTALPLLQRQAASATFGAAASREGLNVDQATANQYATLGVTQQQAEQGFQGIAQALPAEQRLAQIYGNQANNFGTAADQQGNLTAATFGGANAGAAQAKLRALQQQEINAFSGSSGVDKNSLLGSQAATF